MCGAAARVVWPGGSSIVAVAISLTLTHPDLYCSRDALQAEQWRADSEAAAREREREEEARRQARAKVAEELRLQMEEQRGRDKYIGESDLGLTEGMIKRIKGEAPTPGRTAGAGSRAGSAQRPPAAGEGEGEAPPTLSREEVLIRKRMGW